YEDAAGRPLRYRGAEARRPWRGLLGPPRVAVGGDGPVVTATFLGTAFLVDGDGTLLTSRHVARPWEGEDEQEAARELGVTPRLAELRAFFPGVPEPFPLTGGRMSEGADLMLLRARRPPGGAPVLALDPAAAVPGRPVLVMGYPGGLEMLLARVDPRDLPGLLGPDVAEIADDTVDVPR